MRHMPAYVPGNPQRKSGGHASGQTCSVCPLGEDRHFWHKAVSSEGAIRVWCDLGHPVEDLLHETSDPFFTLEELQTYNTLRGVPHYGGI
jgi:hypothetical protein